jgi:hypothetical protein
MVGLFNGFVDARLLRAGVVVCAVGGLAASVARGGNVAGAVMGTYAQTPVMVADGATVYTAWVFADNTAPGAGATWGAQYAFELPGYATLVPGGAGIAYGKPVAARDFFSGDVMAFEELLGPGVVSGRLVNFGGVVSGRVGDLQFYKFTINPGTAVGAGSFALGAGSTMTDASGLPQPFTVLNVPFVITGLAGDLNLDGFVGIADLNLVLGNWNASTGVFSPPAGDSTGDGFVGIEDLNWVLGNWNNGTPPGGGAAVPEPAGVALLGVMGLWGMCRR